MISTRNVNQLKFQKRLIRAAAQSPKVEATHLFAIVARNLEEFLTVRVPLDGDTDTALSEYVELMELLIQAVARTQVPNVIFGPPDRQHRSTDAHRR